MHNLEVEKLIESMPELRELLKSIPPDAQDWIWSLTPDNLKKLMSGDIEGLKPPEDGDMSTFGELNQKDEEIVFLCMRCDNIIPECIVPGSVKKHCSKCNEEVYMSPGTCFSFASLNKKRICCEVCMMEETK